VLTKADKLSKAKREEMHKQIKEYIGDSFLGEMIEFSAETGEGADKIRALFENINSEI